MRIRSDLWVGGYCRRVMAQGGYVVVARRGEASAGAIFLRIDRLDGTGALYGPAPQSLADDDTGARRFVAHPGGSAVPNDQIAHRMAKEIRFDPDCWIVDVEDRAGRSFLEEDEIA